MNTGVMIVSLYGGCYPIKCEIWWGDNIHLANACVPLLPHPSILKVDRTYIKCEVVCVPCI